MDIESIRAERLISDDETKKANDYDVRSVYERDYARLIHSPAFRRLQGKSQVFGAGSGDYFRTRLTHSLEVAQIVRHVARKLYEHQHFTEEGAVSPGLVVNPQVAECAALAHDLGHPPFGHKGEEVLNEILQESKQGLHFEGNAQNFRILMYLEKRKMFNGLNLSSAVLLGTNKYPFLGSQHELKGLYAEEWQAIQQLRDAWGIPAGKTTLEAQLMDLCDDIAYSTHDLEDGIKSKKIQITNLAARASFYIEKVAAEVMREHPEDDELWQGEDIKGQVTKVLHKYFRKWNKVLKDYNYDESRTRREIKAETVDMFVNSIGVIDDGDWKKLTFVKSGRENIDLLREVVILKKLAWTTMINDLRVQRLQKRSEKIVRGLWDSFVSDREGKIIPSDWMERLNANPDWTWEKFILDYIAGMTDSFAEKIYGELFGIDTRSIYDLD